MHVEVEVMGMCIDAKVYMLTYCPGLVLAQEIQTKDWNKPQRCERPCRPSAIKAMVTFWTNAPYVVSNLRHPQ
jgi:hypothetical protein